MFFTSFNFLIFFFILIVVYYCTPRKVRWLTLLVASYFFYINIKPVFALLLAAVTLSTYFFTRLIDGTPVEAKKKIFKICNIILVLLPLFFFKYFGVINNGMNLTNLSGDSQRVVLGAVILGAVVFESVKKRGLAAMAKG